MAETRKFALQRLRGHRTEGNAVHFDVEAGSALVTVTIAVYRGGLVRYRMLPREAAHDLTEAAALADPPAVEARRESDRVVVSGGGVRVEAHVEPWHLAIYADGEARPRVAELPRDLDAHDDPISAPSGFETEAGRPRAARVRFALDAEERYYGLGEKHTPLERRGQRVVCWNVNPYGAGRETAYKNIPLLLGSRGTGFFLNETCRSTWDVGAESNFALSIDVDGPGLDLWVIVARDLKGVLARYADLTGRPAMPPRWSFGLWISPFGEQRASKTGLEQQELVALAGSIREHGLPCDVIHLDPYWMGDSSKMCSFEWDRGHYPDPAALVAALKGLGFRVCLWEHPYLEKGSAIYEEAATAGYLLKRADGSIYDTHLALIPPDRRSGYTESFYAPAGLVDFTNTAAVEWYKSKHRPHLEMGVATFKSDFGEMAPEDAVFANGLTGRQMHNLYPLLYNRAVYEVIGEYCQRPVVWGRSGYAGSQKYPVQGSGDPLADFPNLAATIRAGLSYGLSGVPFWTFDLGGFKGQPTTAAYVRWAQAGLLLSHSRFHGTTPRLPWHYGEQAERIVRDWVRLRYRLLPYITAVAALAVRTGVPVMRPLLLEFPDDPGSADADLQFLLGPSLLAAPVVNEAGEVSFTLPSGTWYDYLKQDRVEGPKRLARTCSLAEIPLYVRGDAMLPFCGDQRTVSDFWDPLGCEIWPAAAGTIEVPEEDGVAASRFETAREGAVRRVSGAGPQRAWQLVVKDVGEPRRIDVTGAAAQPRYDGRRRELVIDIARCASFEARIAVE
jgi:alpha-D-xyloside xylohydrolase